MFGTILEANVSVLIDTSGSMSPYLPNVTKELTSLIWEQLRKNEVRSGELLIKTEICTHYYVITLLNNCSNTALNHNYCVLGYNVHVTRTDFLLLLPVLSSKLSKISSSAVGWCYLPF